MLPKCDWFEVTISSRDVQYYTTFFRKSLPLALKNVLCDVWTFWQGDVLSILLLALLASIMPVK